MVTFCNLCSSINLSYFLSRETYHSTYTLYLTTLYSFVPHVPSPFEGTERVLFSTKRALNPKRVKVQNMGDAVINFIKEKTSEYGIKSRQNVWKNGIYIYNGGPIAEDDADRIVHVVVAVKNPDDGVDAEKNETSTGTTTTTTKTTTTTTTAVEEIDKSFNGFEELERIELPDTIRRIYPSAFEGCSSLTSIQLSKNLRAVECQTFAYCDSLRTIELPPSIVTIGTEAFHCCQLLHRINIPDSV